MVVHHRLYETWGHPELIIIGRSRATSYEILKTLVDDIELNDPPSLTNPDGHVLLGMKCHFLEVNTRYYSDCVGFALWFYRECHFPLYQIVWPDRGGFYPWDENASKPFQGMAIHCWVILQDFGIAVYLDSSALPR